MAEVLDDWIADLEGKRFAAMLSNDPDQLAPFLADDVVYIHSSAVRDGKDAYLASLRDGVLAYRAFRPDYDGVVHLSENAFLLSGRIGIDIALNGASKRLDNLFTAVWKRGDDRAWRLQSWQSTPVPPPAA